MLTYNIINYFILFTFIKNYFILFLLLINYLIISTNNKYEMTKIPSQKPKSDAWMTLIKFIEYKGVFDEIESTGTELILSVKYKVVN